MNKCENNPSCELIGTRTIKSVTYLVYWCQNTDRYEEYEEEGQASAPGKDSSGSG